ncbi:MAG: cation:proton antiporter [Candidatus Izemoplasmataceae bacterium]
MIYLLSTEGSIFTHLHENILFGVSMLVLFGLLGGKLIERIKFPKVTGYILIGILIGPSVLTILSHEMVENFTIIRQVAIGVIGYTIGLELKFRKLKKTGKQVTIITFAQALITAVLVCMAIVSYLTVTGGDHIWTYGLVLGAIATATAPGPIVAIVKSYRTKGPVTDMLLPLVALDDAIGIMLFAVMLSIGTTILGAGASISTGALLLEPLIEIALSFGIGAFLGLAMTFTLKKLNRDDDKTLMMIILGFVFLGIGIGQVVHASAILLPMTIGIVLTNMIDEKYEHRLSGSVDLFAAPILLGFFTIAGAELNLSLLLVAGAMGIIYIVFRVIGKISGAYFSAKIVKAPPTVVKYLGFTLIPQAGVAIDMALTAELRFEEMPGYGYIGMEIMTIVLAATVIFEVFGLIIVKTALSKAGEIDVAKTSWSSQQKA